MIDINKQIFFSWQSDLNRTRHQKFIENCITEAIDKFNLCSRTIKYNLDQATRNLPGSPDIVDSIFNKIENSDIFICDISPIAFLENGKAIPNPNVLIELGYAGKTLGWDNVICVCNLQETKIEQLPFDIRQKRIATYSLKSGDSKPNESKKLIKVFDSALDIITQNKKTQDKVVNLIKTRLDLQLIKVIKIFKIQSYISGFENLFKFFEEMDQGREVKVLNKDILLDIINELTLITRDPFLIISKNIEVDKIYPILELIDLLDLTKDLIIENNEIDDMRKSSIAKLIENIIENWGMNLMINPSRI
jgi:hypothetical protein